MSNTENKFQDIENPRNAYHESMTTSRHTGRHPGTDHLQKLLRPNLRLDSPQVDVSYLVWRLSEDLLDHLGDGPELTAGLRKLLEAKDCFVRQSLSD